MNRRQEQRVTVVYPDSAGIDVAKDVHAVALPANDQGEQPVKMFGAMTEDLQELADYLERNAIRHVAIESTGVYWIALYEILEVRGFDVWLVNPTGLARPDRRKSDVLDCQWIQQLMSLGMLKRSHRPDDVVCTLRSHVRNRQRAIKDRARCVQHMHKALEQMNLKLGSVLSDISGKTGMRIIEAIVNGERDGSKLAKLRDRRVKADEGMIAAALTGNWRDEHLISLKQALSSYHHYSAQIGELEQEILKVGRQIAVRCTEQSADGDGSDASERRGWNAQMGEVMKTVYGVDLLKVPSIGFETVLTLLSEVGADFSAFSSSHKFCQWLGLTPGTNISGGRRLSGAKSRGTQNAGQAFRMSAMTLRRSNSPLGDSHRSRCARTDPPRAIKASAHRLARIVYSMVTNGTEYSEAPAREAERSRRNIKIKRLYRQAEKLGYSVVDSFGDITELNQAVA